jgi:hypothetical protein
MAVADRVDQRRAFIERLKTQKWTESDVIEWREDLLRYGNHLIAVPLFDSLIEDAKKDGRYVNDTPALGSS